MESKDILQYVERDKDQLGIIDILIQDTDNKEIKDSKIAGNFFPVVMIHNEKDVESLNVGQTIQFKDILTFELSSKGFLPTLNLRFVDSSGFFSSLSFNVESSILNIYLKSNNETVFKPVHLNMDILHIKPSGTYQDSNTYIMQCQLRIPNLYTEFCEGMPEMSSYNALMEIANKLHLGFCSNEEDTDDIMTWINPFSTNYEHIEDIALHSYKDVNSFFNTFIDVYYNLNMININACFGNDNTMMGEAYNGISDLKNINAEFETIPLFITNRSELNSLQRYITSYKLVSNTTKTVLQNGYKRKLQFYNQIDNTYLETDDMFVIPISQSEQTEDSWSGINKEYVDKYIKYKYMGKQNENVHDFYMFSKMWNYQNLMDLTQNVLVVELRGIDLSLYRFQTIPVFIYEYNTMTNKAIAMKEEKPENETQLNEFLSGKYVILYIDWSYSYPGNLYQKLYLIKRNYKK